MSVSSPNQGAQGDVQPRMGSIGPHCRPQIKVSMYNETCRCLGSRSAGRSYSQGISRCQMNLWWSMPPHPLAHPPYSCICRVRVPGKQTRTIRRVAGDV
eukprot:362646-Prorocentrum_minimum.AAC.8